MHISWKVWTTASLYLCATLLLLFLGTSRQVFFQKLHFFYQDTTIADRVHTAITTNPNGNTAIFTRFFHNKAAVAADNLFVSLSRSTDPVFFFSLSKNPYYGNDTSFSSVLFFPFFLLASITLLKKWKHIKKQYMFLPILLGISLIGVALFLPYTAPLKLLPLYITVQLIIFFGCYELTRSVTL